MSKSNHKQIGMKTQRAANPKDIFKCCNHIVHCNFTIGNTTTNKKETPLSGQSSL